MRLQSEDNKSSISSSCITLRKFTRLWFGDDDDEEEEADEEEIEDGAGALRSPAPTCWFRLLMLFFKKIFNIDLWITAKRS